MNAKLSLIDKIKDPEFTVHDRTRLLLVSLYGLWRGRFRKGDLGDDGEGDAVGPEFTFDGIEPSVGRYKEPSDLRTFAMVAAVFGKTLEADTQQYDRVVELVRECKLSGIGSVQ